MPRKQIDWEAVQREFRAGQLSVVEIGRQHDVSHTAINKRAKKEGWTRDLTKRVREEVSARLVSDEVSDQVSAKTARETIELAAARGVQIVREHRSDIGRGRRIVGLLLEELERATVGIEEIEDTIEEETSTDENGRRRTTMLKAVSLPARSGAVLNLSSALKNIVGIERQAFGLGNDGAPSDAHPVQAVSITMSPQEAAAAYLAQIKSDDAGQ